MKKYLVLILLFFIGFTSYSQTSNDADAQAFILACDADPAGKLTSDQKNYITQMVEGMKSIGVWDGIKAVYPMVGGTAFKHKFNLKAPTGLQADFTLEFFNGVVHNDNGITGDGVNDYMRTYISANTLPANSNAYAVYIKNQTAIPTGVVFGWLESPSFNRVFVTNSLFKSNNSTGAHTITPNLSSNPKFILLNRQSSSFAYLLNNQNITGSTTQSGILPAANVNIDVRFFNRSDNNSDPFGNTVSSYYAGTFSYAAVFNLGLTDNQAQQLSHLISYLQGILNRQ
jgi:hypothetical protein